MFKPFKSFQSVKECSHVKKTSVFYITVALVLAAAAPLQAQSKNFYEGKIITFLVGSSAGGGTDLSARAIARHIERYIPGKPRIDVEMAVKKTVRHPAERSTG